MAAPCLFCYGNADEPAHFARCRGFKAPYVKGSDTSQAAAESVEDTAVSLCTLILKYIKYSADGMTCSDVEEQLLLRHQTASARLWDLRRRGHIVDSGKRRPSSSGRASTVWVLAV